MMAEYLISLCGVSGSGKTSMEIDLAAEFDLNIPEKEVLFPLRMINCEGLIRYLNNYYKQIKFGSHGNRSFITSRFGILDILINTEALYKLKLITKNQKLDLLKECWELYPIYTFPKILINLSAQTEILVNRLKLRDKIKKQNIIREKKHIQFVRDEYLQNFSSFNFSNYMLEEIITSFHLSKTLLLIDTSYKTPNQVKSIICKFLMGQIL
jgi:cytidylate kinase